MSDGWMNINPGSVQQSEASNPVVDYYSETFASMSIAYAAAHAEEPTEPGPVYDSSIATNNWATPEEETALQLSQDDFEAHLREKMLEIIKAEAEESYVPEETDGDNPYSAVNFGSVWRMVEMESIDFYRNGEAIGETRLVPIVNAEDGILSEGGQRSLNQDAMNKLVVERLASPAGGYERAFKIDSSLNHLIREYVKVHPEGPKEEHYRDLIYGVRLAAAEAVAEATREKVMQRIKEIEEEAAVIKMEEKWSEYITKILRLRQMSASEVSVLRENFISLYKSDSASGSGSGSASASASAEE